MPAPHDDSALPHQRPHALPVAEGGALLDLVFGMLRGASEGPEGGVVAAELDRIILPQAGRDHPPVKLDDPLELGPGEADLRRGGSRKREDVTHQARSRSFPLFSSTSSAIWARSRSTSHWRISSF